MQYWLITHQWRKTETAMQVWKGSLAEWALMAMEQPEDWKLLNASQICAAEYEMLDGKIC